jgi:hypothetical protein
MLLDNGLHFARCYILASSFIHVLGTIDEFATPAPLLVSTSSCTATRTIARVLTLVPVT